MSSDYLIRPKADQDLENQSFYLARHAGLEIGHRFLVAAHETFVFLSRNPDIGWRPRLRAPELENVRVFSISGFEKMLVFYRSLDERIEILRIVHGSRNVLRLLRRRQLE